MYTAEATSLRLASDVGQIAPTSVASATGGGKTVGKNSRLIIWNSGNQKLAVTRRTVDGRVGQIVGRFMIIVQISFYETRPSKNHKLRYTVLIVPRV